MSMKTFLQNQGIPFVGDKIKLPDWCKKVKIDIGLSGNAPHTKLWTDEEKDLLVFGFEPLPENIEMIKKSQSKWPIRLNPNLINDRVYIIQTALGNVENESTAKFYATEIDTGCSSLYKPSQFKIKYEIDVPVWSLHHFLELFPFDKIERIDYMKTDCQGSDLDILKGSKDYINKIAIITSEAEEGHYIGAKNGVKDIDNYLKKHGFTMVRTDNANDPTFYNEKYIDDFSFLLNR